MSLMSRGVAGGSSEPFGHEMLRFQDPGSIFRPLRAERTLRGAHCLEGKTEAQRRVWLAQSHVVVARKGTVLHVCLPDSKTVWLAGPWAWVGDLCPQRTPLPPPDPDASPGVFPPVLQRGGGLASWGPVLLGRRPRLAPGSPAFRQPPKYVYGCVDSRSCHVPRACTKENTECFLDDTVSIPSHAFLREGYEEGVSAVCRSGALLRHPVLSADVGPWAVSTAKDSLCQVAVPWAGSCHPVRAGSRWTAALSRS